MPLVQVNLFQEKGITTIFIYIEEEEMENLSFLSVHLLSQMVRFFPEHSKKNKPIWSVHMQIQILVNPPMTFSSPTKHQQHRILGQASLRTYKTQLNLAIHC